MTTEIPTYQLETLTDVVDAPDWDRELASFEDANIYQAWSREVTRAGKSGVTRVALRRDDEIVALAQARIVRMPATGPGLAYVRWGPVWRKRGQDPGGPEAFRHILRALRRELVQERGFALRLMPKMYHESDQPFVTVLEEEGFEQDESAPVSRTLVMDLEPDVDDLLAGLHHKWRYHYRKGLKKGLDVVHGTDDSLFEEFAGIYADMQEFKSFLGDRDIRHTRAMQGHLPESIRSRVFLCRREGKTCAGGIVSPMGDMGIYLHGATNREGRDCYASYLVHWRMLEWVKSAGCRRYDLNGFDPDPAHGPSRFKRGLGAGHGVVLTRMAPFEAFPTPWSRMVFRLGQRVREYVRSFRGANPDG